MTTETSDIQKYLSAIESVRSHLRVVDAVYCRRINTGHADLNAELIFLHFRKALEELAFSSLASNREKYSAQHPQFGRFWKAKELLKEIGELNPLFYPRPIVPGSVSQTDDGRDNTHFEGVREGFLTQDDFVFLYLKASDVLHSRNPYKSGDPTINVKHEVPIWLTKFHTLLRLHFIHLVDAKEAWLVEMPEQGKIHALMAREEESLVIDVGDCGAHIKNSYLFIEDGDAAEYTAQGLESTRRLANMPWHSRREFVVKDCDGRLLALGANL
jgi:hypothetical protein